MVENVSYFWHALRRIHYTDSHDQVIVATPLTLGPFWLLPLTVA